MQSCIERSELVRVFQYAVPASELVGSISKESHLEMIAEKVLPTGM